MSYFLDIADDYTKAQVHFGSDTILEVVFKNGNDTQDITTFLPTDGTLSFTLTASDVGLKLLTGLHFIIFKTTTKFDDCKTCSNEHILPIIRIERYYECLFKKIMHLELDGCEEQQSNCSECSKRLTQTHILLNSFEMALGAGYFDEAEKIKDALDDYCEVCEQCPEENFIMDDCGCS